MTVSIDPIPPAPAPSAATCVLLAVWPGGPAGFRARAMLGDGSAREFDSPFELVRFLVTPTPPPDPPRRVGLR